MAKDNISLPQGMAGLQSFRQDEESKIRIKPMYVIVIVVIVLIFIFLLHIFGNSLFGIKPLQ